MGLPGEPAAPGRWELEGEILCNLGLAAQRVVGLGQRYGAPGRHCRGLHKPGCGAGSSSPGGSCPDAGSGGSSTLKTFGCACVPRLRV